MKSRFFESLCLFRWKRVYKRVADHLKIVSNYGKPVAVFVSFLCLKLKKICVVHFSLSSSCGTQRGDYLPATSRTIVYILQKINFRVLSSAVVHLSILTIQRRLALSLHKDDTLYKEIYHFFWQSSKHSTQDEPIDN